MNPAYHSPEAIFRRAILRPVGRVDAPESFAARLLERFLMLPFAAWPQAWDVVARGLAGSLEVTGWDPLEAREYAARVLASDREPPDRFMLYSLWNDAARVLEGHAFPIPCPIGVMLYHDH